MTDKEIRIIIMGTGKSSEIVRKCIDLEKVNLVCYADNDTKNHGRCIEGIPILPLKEALKKTYDYLIVASLQIITIQPQLEHCGVERERIIYFFTADDTLFEKCKNFINLYEWKYAVLKKKTEVRMEKLEKKVESYMCNIEYEIADRQRKECYWFPNIHPGSEAVEKILHEHCSMCRFGDGEFEIMAGRERAGFQRVERHLGERLREVLESREDNIIIGIADNYGNLQKYTEEAADAIRVYMTPEVRSFHRELLERDRIYYDAYMTRPYILYRNKKSAKQRFVALKQIWQGRETVIIEGSGTRMGYGNDLLDGTVKIERIICPNENAFSWYEEILAATKKVEKDKLILIALGPTATVLAYDLAKAGYQAVDIGHIDNEYEWFLRGSQRREDIRYKYVNECAGGNVVEDIDSTWYQSQIIVRIG